MKPQKPKTETGKKYTARIRRARPEDARRLEAFLAFNAGKQYRSLARKYIRSMFSGLYHRPTFMIAVEDDEIVGSAACSREFFTFTSWGISWVNVHPGKRNCGLGQALVEACLHEIARKAGTEKVTVILGTLPGKSALYDRLGFRKGGVDHQGGWYMTKTVSLQSTKSP